MRLRVPFGERRREGGSIARGSLVAMTSAAVLYYMSRGVVGPLSSLYAESLGADYVSIGLLGMVSSVALVVFSTIWGRVSDRLGRRKTMLLPSLLTMGLGYGLMALAPDYRFLFPLYGLAAIAQAGYDANSLALLGDQLERRSSERGRRVGVYRGFCSLGFGVVAFFAGSVAEWLSMQVAYAIAAAFLGLAALAITWVVESGTRSTTQPQASEGRRDAVATQPTDTAADSRDSTRLPLAPLLVAAFLWSLMFGAVYAVWANYMVSDLGYTASQMSRLWAIASISELPLMILAGWLSDRVGRLPMLSLGFVAWALVFTGYLVIPQMPWIVLVQLLRGFAFSAFTATAMAYVGEVRASSQRGRVSGLYASAGGIGAILGAPLGGTMAQLMGFRVMIAFNAALFSAGAVYLGVVAWRWRHRAGP